MRSDKRPASRISRWAPLGGDQTVFLVGRLDMTHHYSQMSNPLSGEVVWRNWMLRATREAGHFIMLMFSVFLAVFLTRLARLAPSITD